MPKVNPDTHEPMSDQVDGPDDQRGGKKLGDPALAGASEQGRGHRTGDDLSDERLPGERASTGSVEKP